MRAQPGQIGWMRIAAFTLDVGVASAAALLVGSLLGRLAAESPSLGPLLIQLVWAACWIGMVSFLLLRDSIDGGSPGRRVLGLSVVRSRDRRGPRVWQSIARNLPLLVPIWNLVELWSLRRNPYRRFGDFLAGTSVQEA